MLIHSDFHIHSEYSYDANLPLATIAEGAKACDFVRVGISDHLNFNDPPFIGNIRDSAAGVKEASGSSPGSGGTIQMAGRTLSSSASMGAPM